MSINPQTALMHYADFEAYTAMMPNRDRLLELFMGGNHRKNADTTSWDHAIKIGAHLLRYAETHGGRVGAEIRHKLLNDDHNALQPDVAYYRQTTHPIVERDPTPYMPDIVVEIKSPDDTLWLMRNKADYYLAHGTQAVWIIYPEKRLVIVYTPQDEIILNDTDTLTMPDILPQFELSVAYIFE